MSKRPVSLSLRLAESEGTVTLLLEDDGKSLIDFENTDAPPVRVNGFTKRSPDFQRILTLMERERLSFSGGALEVLNVYINSLEKQSYNKTLELRKEMRKLAILGVAVRTAKILQSKELGKKLDEPQLIQTS